MEPIEATSSSLEEQVVKALEYGVAQIKWRLKHPSKRRLETDVLGLCSGMRPVVMVDYGGKMPDLQHHLCSLIKLCQQESAIFKCLRVMVIEEMIYLVHVRGLAEYINSSLNSETELYLVNLEQDPPQMIPHAQDHPLKAELIKVQKLFSLVFPLEGKNDDIITGVANAESSITSLLASQSPEFVDLSSCMQDTEVTVPTLNGWLLGYPVVYLFSKKHIEDAIYNLSTKYLHIFQIRVCRSILPDRGSQPEELMSVYGHSKWSGARDCDHFFFYLPCHKLTYRHCLHLGSFSVPYELSMRGSDEPWAKAFVAQMQSKRDKCNQTWRSLEMEVLECYPQAIVL